MKKLIKIISLSIAIILIVLTLIVVTVGFIPFNIQKPSYKLMKSAALDSVYTDKATLRLPNKFKFKNLRILNSLSNTHTLNLDFKNLQGDVRVIHTITKSDEILQRIKGKFNWEFKQKEDHHLPFLYKQITGADTLLVPIIKKMSLKGGKVSIDSLGSNILLVDDISLKVVTKESNHPNFSTSIEAKRFNLYGIKSKDINGKIDIKSKNLTIPNLTGTIAEGQFRINDAAINIEKNIVHNLEVSLKKSKLEKLLTLEKGKISGTLNLNASIDTSFLSLEELKGEGDLSIKNLSAEDIPLLKKAVRITDIKSLRSVYFKNFETDFIVSENRISSDSIIATGEDFSIYGSGYLKPENLYFNYKIKGIFESHMKDSMSALVWDALLPMKDGRKYFKCTISGTPKRPGIDLEREMVKSAARSIFRSIKKDFKSLFK